MDKKEFANIVSAIKTAYPASQILDSEQAIELWYKMLADLDYKACQMAVLEIISTSKFPPSIAEIREKCSQLIAPPIKDWSEAWEDVIRSIGKYGMYQTQEALSSFDELTRKCVNRIGYVNICMSENIAADRANFRMIYEAEVQKKRAENQLPLALRTEKQKMLDALVNDTVKQIGG